MVLKKEKLCCKKKGLNANEHGLERLGNKRGNGLERRTCVRCASIKIVLRHSGTCSVPMKVFACFGTKESPPHFHGAVDMKDDFNWKSTF